MGEDLPPIGVCVVCGREIKYGASYALASQGLRHALCHELDARTLERVAAWLEEKAYHAGMLVTKHGDDPTRWQTMQDIAAAIRRGEPMGGTDGAG